VSNLNNREARILNGLLQSIDASKEHFNTAMERKSEILSVENRRRKITNKVSAT